MLTTLQAGLVHVHDEAGAAVEGDRQRLCAAHATAATGQGEGAGQAAAEALLATAAKVSKVPCRIPWVAM